MRKTTLILCLMFVFLPVITHAGEPGAPSFSEIETEIERLFKAEQEAFKKGDCEQVVSYFNEDVTFYANGRRIPSLNVLQEFCKRIPRPFDETGEIHDSVHVVSGTTAYTVRKIDFQPGGESAGSHKREVITKIWSKSPSGWKIVHFHSSVGSVPNQQQ